MLSLHWLCSFVLLLVACSSGIAQCLTDFEKLVPEPTLDYAGEFGYALSAHGDLAAIGTPTSDSLGRITGVVYLYERQPTNAWKKIASFAPSDPRASLQFGHSVKLSANYLAVGAAGYGGIVYVFKKPLGGWTNATENYQLNVAGTVSFGTSYNDPIDISDDERTLAIVDQNQSISTSPIRLGAIYIYHKQVGEWNMQPPVRLIAPEDDAVDFGRAGVHILGDRIATATPFAPTGTGRGYIYRDASGTFTNLTLEAKLSTTAVSLTANIGFNRFAFLDEGFVTVASVGEPWRTGLVYFRKPASNHWVDAEPTCSFDLSHYAPGYIGNVSVTTNGTNLFAGFSSSTGDSKIALIETGMNEWCDPQVTTIKTIPFGSSNYVSSYARFVTASGNNVISRTATLPGNINAPLAVEALRFNGATWLSSLIYQQRTTTAGHFFGRTVLTFDDHLFVSSPYDASLKPSGGAVYCYKKVAGIWLKVNKILPHEPEQYDDVFGFTMATDGSQLAVGAPGYEDGGGRVFIYNRTGSDWSHTQLVQQIKLPDSLNAHNYGDHVAISNNWLIIPYIVASPFRIKLAIYQKTGDQWILFQSLETQFGNFFARETTIDVDIDDETIVAGGHIIQRNAQGLWELKYLLSPSDPEAMRISSDFTHWITDGSNFGLTVDIQGDHIFIGAPTKDFGTTWNVGAVYVYSRQPGFEWSSMTETHKLLPRVKDENELFGYALHSLENTLIVGAPGADYEKNGVAPRNKPGRAYIFQSKEYYWNDVIPLMDFTGDSFTKDYFGLSVALDGDNFLIGAPIEDIPTGALSGSIYVAPSPPIVRLVPPTCVTTEQFDLFAYPFGGTWSGPGLIDPIEGIFSPTVAGTGTHVFEYTTPSCTYKGILLIKIMAPPITDFPPASEIIVCEESTSISKLLSAPQVANVNYQWFYREKSDLPFIPLEQRAATMLAASRGEYAVRVRNLGCSVLGPVHKIENEVISLQVDLPAITCNNTVVPLAANPTGGTWSGGGVTGSNFSSAMSGAFRVNYKFTSANQCVFEKADTIQVISLTKPLITRGGGNLCENGEVSLSVGSIPEASTVTWQFKSNSASGFIKTGFTSTNIDVSTNGSYQATVTAFNCTQTSNAFDVNDQLVVTTSPSNDVAVCHGQTLVLQANAIAGTIFQWWYAMHGSDLQEQVRDGNTIEVSQSGIYRVEGKSGLCSATTDPVQVTVFPADTIIAPNVITPNGDNKNDKLVISVGRETDVILYNRYGKEVFRGNTGLPWDGGEHPTGVYYWIAKSRGCMGEERLAKGFVQLIR
jgi:hypothetical protein